MSFDPPILRTTRLVLRPYVLSDAAQLQALAGARAIADTTRDIPHPYPDGAAEAWIASYDERWRAGTFVSFAICDSVSDAVFGGMGLTIKPEYASGELGYWIGVPFWGRGYCTEAAREVLAYGFEGLRLQRIEASHLTRNPASGRVLHKLGMQREGVRRDAIKKWEVFEDVAIYAILAPEWTALQHDRL